MESKERTLLLVDDEENILRSLARLFRRDGYRILTANSGQEGLEILKDNEVGVIISDQRMPTMSGVEFLSNVKDRYPDTVRIMLSGYTELESVTDAINRGAIYKFLTKPWEEGLLRENIEEAFRRHEMTRENERLSRELKQSNDRLTSANRELEEYAALNYHALQVSQEVLEILPIGVVGFGDDDVVAFANRKAHAIFSSEASALIGRHRDEVLPRELRNLPRALNVDEGRDSVSVVVEGMGEVECIWYRLESLSAAKGFVLVLLPKE